MKNILETTGSFCTKYIYIYYVHIEVIGSVYMGNILININKQYIYIYYIYNRYVNICIYVLRMSSILFGITMIHPDDNWF